jgi:dTDP-4-amino-4,6-dideoxygalactose transaminase
VWHLYVVRVPDRDLVLERLHAAGVGAGIHYPAPVHLTGAFGHLAPAGSLPVAEREAGRLLTLPLFPQITEDQQRRTVEVIAEALG